MQDASCVECFLDILVEFFLAEAPAKGETIWKANSLQETCIATRCSNIFAKRDFNVLILV